MWLVKIIYTCAYVKYVSVNYIHWNFISRLIETSTNELRKLYYKWNEWEDKKENEKCREDEKCEEDEDDVESEKEKRFDINCYDHR